MVKNIFQKYDTKLAEWNKFIKHEIDRLVEKNVTNKMRTENPCVFEIMWHDQRWGTDIQQAPTSDDIVGYFTGILTGLTHSPGAALTAVVWLLGSHPQTQDKARNEVEDIINRHENEWKNNGGKFTSAMLSELKYVTWCVKEANRLIPPLAATIRQVNSGPDGVTIGSLNVPNETLLVLNLEALHRNPHHWGPDADKFIPERFNADSCAARHPYAYAPFLGGKRVCPGISRAYAFLSITLAQLLLNFSWESKEGLASLQFEAGPHISFAKGDLNICFTPNNRRV